MFSRICTDGLMDFYGCLVDFDASFDGFLDMFSRMSMDVSTDSCGCFIGFY